MQVSWTPHIDIFAHGINSSVVFRTRVFAARSRCYSRIATLSHACTTISRAPSCQKERRRTRFRWRPANIFRPDFCGHGRCLFYNMDAGMNSVP
jgi:hypothetical protein